jgi:hypothetical protein
LNPYVVALTYAVVGLLVIPLGFAVFRSPYQLLDVILAGYRRSGTVVYTYRWGRRLTSRDRGHSLLAHEARSAFPGHRHLGWRSASCHGSRLAPSHAQMSARDRLPLGG